MGGNKVKMKNMPDGSIVVTVHNSETYLEECLNSVCRQTYKNIEILCVDGGSKDNSPGILKKFADADSRIKIINDPNTSYGHKLNLGFELAKGKYVGILESDDRLCLDMVENLYRIADQYRPDVVGGNVRRSFDYEKAWVGYEVQVYKNPSYYNRFIVKSMEPIQYAHGSIYASLYKKSFLATKDIKVNETPGAAFQDQGFSFMTDILAETAYYIDKPVYEYRIDNTGSSVYDDRKIFEIVWEMRFIEQELKRKEITDPNIWNEFWYTKYLHFIDRMKCFSKVGREQFKRAFESELRADMQHGILGCGIFKEGQEAILQGFLADPFYFEKNFEQVDSMSVKKIGMVLGQILDKPVVIFGAGQKGKYFCRILKDLGRSFRDGRLEVTCFCDNAPELEGKIIMGKPVLSVEQAVERFPEAIFAVANVQNSKDMVKQLKTYGIREENICF